MLIKGTLYQRFVKCGRPVCACGSDPARRHGPYWYLRWWEAGCWHKRYIKAEDVSAVRALIEARRQITEEAREARTIIRQVCSKLRASGEG